MTAAAQDWLRGLRGKLGERRLWSNAPTVQHLGELMAWFCLGELQSWPGHSGPTCTETREANLGPVLAAANRRGFITVCSQPGIDRELDGFEQRAAVEGLTTPAVLAQLRGLAAGTRLQVIAHPASRWRRDYGTAVDVTRVGEQEVTGFGVQASVRDIRFDFAGVPDHVVDELVAMQQVTIVDPQWGAHRLLWDRLAEPDWDHPTAPQETTVPAIPPEPSVGTVLQTSDKLDTYRIEHLPDGWALQYRPDESEHGLTHLSSRISWASAWKTWGPPAGAAPFITVPPGAPALPPCPPEPVPGWVGMGPDASDQHIAPPPAAKPHRPTRRAPAPRTTTTSGGTTVSTSIQEIQGVIASITDTIGITQGPIQHLIDEAVRARAALMASMDGTHQPDVEAAVAILSAMIASLTDALGQSHQATQATEQIGRRL